MLIKINNEDFQHWTVLEEDWKINDKVPKYFFIEESIENLQREVISLRRAVKSTGEICKRNFLWLSLFFIPR